MTRKIGINETSYRLLAESNRPRDEVASYRKAIFYFLRNIFEGPTHTLAWMLFFYSVLWTIGVTNPLWPIDFTVHLGVAAIFPPLVYGVIFISITLYQLLCHIVIECSSVWRTIVAAINTFIVVQICIIPMIEMGPRLSSAYAGDLTVATMAVLLLTRSFPTWLKREHGR